MVQWYLEMRWISRIIKCYADLGENTSSLRYSIFAMILPKKSNGKLSRKEIHQVMFILANFQKLTISILQLDPQENMSCEYSTERRITRVLMRLIERLRRECFLQISGITLIHFRLAHLMGSMVCQKSSEMQGIQVYQSVAINGLCCLLLLV